MSSEIVKVDPIVDDFQTDRLQEDAYSEVAQSKVSFATATHGVVKSFSPKRGFGFVALSDGSGDAFLHRTLLGKFGIDGVEADTVLRIRLAQGDRGPKIVEVLGVGMSTLASGAEFCTVEAEPSAERGTVNGFKSKRGYGFIERDGGGQDAFFHVSWLNRHKVASLAKGQRVIMDVVEGQKGPKARKIRLI